VSVLMCPPPDEEPYPTLGLLVCDFIEENLCHGPGDLLGVPVVLNEEQQAWLAKIYEVEPPKLERRVRQVISRSANPRAGRRRFQRCALSWRKGSSKTEFAAWIAIAELHPDGPVRCDGFDGLTPIPRGVIDPYIPMISSTEEQTEELAYGALRRILEEVPLGGDFDIGLERILRRDGKGKAEAVSASPNARDGARTTFEHCDESHRLVLDNQKRAWTVMLANLAKRPLADPWALETTTAPEPGAGSVAESTMEYARAVLTGRAENSRLFFFHRQADDSIDITTRKGLKKGIVDASGPYIAQWSDIDRIAAAFEEPDADRSYLERVWLNRLVQSSGGAFDMKKWRALKTTRTVPSGAAITVGFDGSRFDDATALIACELETGHIWPLGIWERPRHLPEWEVPTEQVDGAVADAFERYHVCRMYCDPPKWETWVAKWAGQYGTERVVEWWTNRRKPMAYALRSFVGAISTGEVSHDGNEQLDDHMGNARQAPTNLVDEEEKPLWILRKERPDSPKKIDAAMGAVLAWEARNDAIAAGEGVAPEPAIYFLKAGR
jgi:phage terminase large subunit-like protein